MFLITRYARSRHCLSFLVEWDKLDNLWPSLLTLLCVIHAPGKPWAGVSLRMTAMNLRSKGWLWVADTAHSMVQPVLKNSLMGCFLKTHKEGKPLGEQELHF